MNIAPNCPPPKGKKLMSKRLFCSYLWDIIYSISYNATKTFEEIQKSRSWLIASYYDTLSGTVPFGLPVSLFQREIQRPPLLWHIVEAQYKYVTLQVKIKYSNVELFCAPWILSFFFIVSKLLLSLFTQLSHHFLREAFLDCPPCDKFPITYSDGTVYPLLVECDSIELFLFGVWDYLIIVPHPAKLSAHQIMPSSYFSCSYIPSGQHSACHSVDTQHILCLMKEEGKRKQRGIEIYIFNHLNYNGKILPKQSSHAWVDQW